VGAFVVMDAASEDSPDRVIHDELSLRSLVILAVVYSAPLGAIDWPGWLTGLGTLSLVLVAAIALRQLAELRRDRHVHVLIELGQRWDGADLQAAREKAIELGDTEIARLASLSNKPSRDAAARQSLVLLLRVPNYFEDLAVIIEESRAEIDVVGRLFKALIVDEWEFWKPAITAWREDDAFVYTQFEKLATRMRTLPDE
jgi:hypothetical protein